MRKALAVISMAGALAMSTSAYAAPVFDTFGLLAQATFGGSGIPNDAVAIATQNNITLGLTATERFSNAPVGNDSAGTFFAAGGSNFGDPLNPGGPGPSSSLGATWNFDWFIDTGAEAFASFGAVTLAYDVDPGAGTDFGFINFHFGDPAGTLNQGSENMLFGFLSSAALVPIIIPPAGVFNPDVSGIYSFVLTLSGGSLSQDLVVGIDVVVSGTNVPEPGTLALFGAGLTGLILARRRRKSVN